MSEPSNAIVQAQPKRSLVATLAAQYDMEPQPFLDAIAQTVMPTDRQINNAQIAAFLMVCNEHGLNPFTREIFAFPSKSGGIQPIVSIDGWLKLILQHPQYNGMDIDMLIDEKTGKPVSCTCTIHRKDRETVTPITEYFDECYRNTDPWNKMPKRMMRHKAIKEAGRYTFGFAGIKDEDEGLDTINVTSEATIMSRETNSKAEQLKEKIGAKKAEKAKEAEAHKPEPAPALAPVPTPAVEPPKEIFPPAMPEPPDDFPPPEGTAAAEPEPDRLLTEQERKSILQILMDKKPQTVPEHQQLEKDARQHFMSYGATSTKQLKLSNLESCLAWAEAYQIPKV